MPWNWGKQSKQSLYVGGDVGTRQEADNVSTWPNYDAAYLAKRLGSQNPTNAYQDRYMLGRDPANWGGDETARQVYLEKVTSDFEREADECLKKEFVDWLQGTHEDNVNPQPYPNRPGQAPRRAITKMQGNGGQVESGAQLDGWIPTRWGTSQLTHLDGVRDFLRANKERAEMHELSLNILAEFGPQNIDQAWTYFKHWVKGRPVAPEECIHVSQDDKLVTRSETNSMNYAQEPPPQVPPPFDPPPQVPPPFVFGAPQPPAPAQTHPCLLYTSPSPRDGLLSRMPSSA